MKKSLSLLFCLAFLAAAPGGAICAPGTRVAVPVFVDASGSSIYGRLKDSVTDMLVSELAKNPDLNLVERRRLDEAVAEARLSLSGMVDPQTAVAVGNMVGAGYIVLGTITKASIEDKTTRFIITSRSRKAQVTLVVRVVDAGTGVTVASAEASGDAERSSATIDPSVVGVKGPNNQPIGPIGGGTIDVESDGLLREAAAKAVADLGPKVCAAIPKGQSPDLQGYVVKVNGSRVFIDLGRGQIAPGAVLTVQREGEELFHPVTGKSLGMERYTLGSMQVLEVFDGYSVAQVKEGGGFSAGDKVKISQ